MSAATSYGQCVAEWWGGSVVVVRADKRVLISDDLLATAEAQTGHAEPAAILDGNLVTFGSDAPTPVNVGVVTYELVSWDSRAKAHVGVRVK